MPVHLHKDLERLKKVALEMGTLVEESISSALRALTTCDRRLAEQVIDGDMEIDRREVLVEEECLKILALHQPVARDLRFVVAVLKLNNDLERIGDFAVNMAERALILCQLGSVTVPPRMMSMAQKAAEMVRQSMDSLVESDADLAKSVIVADDEVDRLRDELFTQVLDQIRHDLDHLDQWIQILSSVRYLERIADLATNIAQDVVYLIEGEVVRHQDLTLPPHSSRT